MEKINVDEFTEKHNHNIHPKTEEQQSSSLRSLYIVSVLCFFFMVIEVIGGYLANSIAIMSDAAHMFSDLLGFIISIFSIYIAKRSAVHSMSFGYHRAEVIGALSSVMIIWGLTLWLIYEAGLRLLYPSKVDGGTMLIVAILGLVFNIIMGYILYYYGIDHGMHHSHAGHDHEHSHACESKDHDHKHDHKHDHDHDHKHDHKHDHNDKHHSHIDIIDNNINNEISDNTVPLVEKADGSCCKTAPVVEKKVDSCCKGNDKNETKTTHQETDTEMNNINLNKINNIEELNNKDRKVNIQESNDNLSKAYSRDKEHMDNLKSHSHGDMNIKAAIVHVIGDAIQNIGVIISGAIIYYKPDLVIVDSLCTFFFAIIVFYTTFTVIKPCLQVIMEGSPIENIEGMTTKLLAIKGVKEVHDLHVWALSSNKFSMTCHLVSDNPQKSLKAATKLIREVYGIDHTTIQVEDSTSIDTDSCKQTLHQVI